MPKKPLKDYKNPKKKKKSTAPTFSITHTNPKITTYYSKNHSQISAVQNAHIFTEIQDKEREKNKRK